MRTWEAVRAMVAASDMCREHLRLFKHLTPSNASTQRANRPTKLALQITQQRLTMKLLVDDVR
eukprot:318358-Amphidinium_carterae.1